MGRVLRTPKQVREVPQGRGPEADTHSLQTGAPGQAAHRRGRAGAYRRGRAGAHRRGRASSTRKEKAGGGEEQDSRAGERAPAAEAGEQGCTAPSGPARASQPDQQTASLVGGG